MAFFLPGPSYAGLRAGKIINRAVHLAGGVLTASLEGVGDAYSVELWFWNGLPNDARPVTGVLFSLGASRAGMSKSDDLGIGGTQIAPRGLFFSAGATDGRILSGKTEIAPQTWHHVALVRTAKHVAVYLDGNPSPEIAPAAEVNPVKRPGSLSIGGRSDGLANFEGKIDEIALYDRPLDAAEITSHVRAAGAR